MSRPPRFNATTVARVVGEALGAKVETAQHHAVGWGNENWRIVTTAGDRYLAKFGPPDSWPKWSATHGVYAEARAAGVPVPELVHARRSHPDVDGWIVRVFTWIEGHGADAVVPTLGRRERDAFFRDLGAAVARLHTLPAKAFGSRLDASTPMFDSWSAYVAWRLPAVAKRAAAAGAYAPGEFESHADLLIALVDAVSPACTPTVCHRDLYLDNVMVDRDGGVVALIDFDGAEAWDAASDLSKLRWMAFPLAEGSEAAFLAGYHGGGPEPVDWHRRVVAAELLELLNAVPNAVASGAADFEASARGRLAEVLALGRAL